MTDIKISQLSNVSSNELTDLFEISRNLGGGSFESKSIGYHELLHSVLGQTVITVGSNGANAETIEDGITHASELSPSITNPIVILVHPGVYTENPLILPDYVSIIAIGDDNSTFVDAIDTTAAILTIGNYSSIQGLYVRNANGVGGIGFKGEGTNSTFKNCAVENCETGFYCSDGGGSSSKCYYCAVINYPGKTCTYAYRADNGSIFTLSNCIANGVSAISRIGNGLYAEGSGTTINVSSSYVFYCTNGFHSDDSGFIDAGDNFLNNCVNSLRISSNGSNSRINSLATSIRNTQVYSVLIESITGSIRFTGRMDYSKRSIASGAKFISLGMDDLIENVKLTAETNVEDSLIVGVPGATDDALGVNMVVGEGGSYNTDRDGNAIVEYWAYDASAASGSRFTRYDSNTGTQLTDEGDCIVVGSKYLFSAITLDVNTAANVGSNNIVAEHWNGATWMTDMVCAYRKEDFANRRNVIFQNVETQYVEFNTSINDDWVSDSNALNEIPDWDAGFDMYPVRFRNNGGSIITAMEFDSGKVRGDDFEVTVSQKVVNFGRFRGEDVSIKSVLDMQPDSVNTPENTTINISANITEELQANCTNGNVSSLIFQQIIPVWADISSGVQFRLDMYSLDANAGNVEILVRYIPIISTFIWDGTATEYSESLVAATPLVAYKKFSANYTFDISSFAPGTNFVVSLTRDATAGNPLDTYDGDVVVTGCVMTWTRKIVG